MKRFYSLRYFSQFIVCLSIFWMVSHKSAYGAMSEVVFQLGKNQIPIPAWVEKHYRVSLDIFYLAEILGGKTRVSNGIYVIQMASSTVKINPNTNIFSMKNTTTPGWQHIRLNDRCVIRDGRVFVTLESIPGIFEQSFTYHLQKRILAFGTTRKPTEMKNLRMVSVRYVNRDNKVWISVQDLSKILGLIVYSFRAGSYSLTFPDLTILELTVGSPTIIKHRSPYRVLSDPVLSFSGAPYVTLNSLNALYEIEARWDPTNNVLLIPAQYGRFQTVDVVEKPRIFYIGYKPEPLKIVVDGMSAYYQEPDPIYSSPYDRPLESVRDRLTDETVRTKKEGSDQFNGTFDGGLEGSLFGAPFDAKGYIEKLGSRTYLDRGGMKWGFPILRLEAGREYLTFGGLVNQYSLVDMVSLSHSNDHYDEGKTKFVWQLKGLYAEQDYDLYASSDYFTQSLLVKQKIGMAGLGTQWKISPRQSLSFKWEGYTYEDEVKNQSAYFDPELQELLSIIYGTAPVTVDPADSEALIEAMFLERHISSIVDMNYGLRNIIDLTGTMGMSQYEDKLQEDKKITDSDWKVRAILGNTGHRVDASFENVGENYRSAGNPFIYSNRSIVRVAPYLDIAKWWRLFGEYKVENIGEFKLQGIPEIKTVYASAINIFTIKRNVARINLNNFDSSQYGSRSAGSLDLTQFIGAHSIDVGGGGTLQYYSADQIYRRSYTGKLGFSLNGKTKKLSLAEEYTRHTYPLFDLTNRYESHSNLVLRLGGVRLLGEYNIEPRFSISEEYIYTSTARLGYEIFDKKFLNVFYAISSVEPNLSHPEVWRVGLEYTTSLF